VLDREEAWLRGRAAAKLLEARDGVELPPSPPGTTLKSWKIFLVFSSVEDPHVFGPPGSGFISQRYGSGSFHFLINVLSKLK
jgi:hypothetical protein